MQMGVYDTVDSTVMNEINITLNRVILGKAPQKIVSTLVQ